MLEKFITFMLVGRDEEKGATATEYSLLVAFIAIVLVAGVTVFGQGLSQAFTNLADWLDGLAAAL